MENGTPKQGETSNPETPKNGTQISDSSEVEKLRAELKEAQQKAMRVSQVENELAKIKEDEEKRKQAELEEQNQFKTLHEQEKAKREALESRLEAEERQKELAKVRAEASKDYSDEVKAEAEALGITLGSTDEAEVAAYKEKLERIQKRENASSRVTPNNPNTTTGDPTQDELLRRVRVGDRNARAQAIGNLEAVKTMKAMAGYSK